MERSRFTSSAAARPCSPGPNHLSLSSLPLKRSPRLRAAAPSGRMTVERADGEQLLGSGATPLRVALHAAGFVSTPRGLRLRA